MWSSNPTWGAPRIQAELRKIGIEVSDSTIRRYRPPRVGPPSQTWRSFLDNHLADLAAIDFFIVPTVTFPVLYVLLIMSHDRRRILHFNVTTSPSARWTARQVVVQGERHLLRALQGYASYWTRPRTKDSRSSNVGTVDSRPCPAISFLMRRRTFPPGGNPGSAG